MKQYFVYMLSSENNNALYTGVTNDLERLLYEHKEGLAHGFTKKYKCKKLVHYEVFEDPENAILREKEIKGWVRKRKNELIEKANPDWQNLDPSVQALQDDKPFNFERYTRQLALPEISMQDQQRLAKARILMVGAGGLGTAALPAFAAAGIGHITIMDDDSVDRSNLHRQTIYKDRQIGESKAALAAAYCRDLNPDIEIKCHPERLALKDLDPSARALQDDYDLILDGSDNFETKTLLNQMSIETRTPLISASVNQWAGQIGIFGGFAKNAPCYHCLFPELPSDARNCNEAGILGTSANITGLYQAHLALCFLAGLKGFEPGLILSFDFKTLRMQKLQAQKDPSCVHCKGGQHDWQREEKRMAELISMAELADKTHLIVDVRTAEEIEVDPIQDALHMELQTVPGRHEELPKDKLLAFVCAGNVRSVQAAEYLEGLGYNNVCVLDKFSL